MKEKVKMLGDPSKFEWAQMFNNENGKTSASSFAGLFMVVTGGFAFLFELYFKNVTMIEHVITYLGLGTALLGVRKWMNTKVTPESYETSTSPDVEFIIPESAMRPDIPEDDEE